MVNKTDTFRGGLSDVLSRMNAVLELHLNAGHIILGVNVVPVTGFAGTIDYVGIIFHAVKV